MFEVTDTFELSLDYNGYNYLVIYGKHINGGFWAIPNHGICGEAGEPDEVFYNAESIARRIEDKEAAEYIAMMISQCAEMKQQEENKCTGN